MLQAQMIEMDATLGGPASRLNTLHISSIILIAFSLVMLISAIIHRRIYWRISLDFVVISLMFFGVARYLYRDYYALSLQPPIQLIRAGLTALILI